MIVSLVAVIVIFFAARLVASLGIDRAAYRNVAGACAVFFFGLGIWAGHALFAVPPPPVVTTVPAKVVVATPTPANVAPARNGPATPSPNGMSREQIAGLTPSKGGQSFGAIDAITAGPGGGNPPPENVFPAGSTIFVFGWTASSAKKPFAGLVIAIDGRPRFEGTAGYGGARGDVAAFFKTPQMTDTAVLAVGVSTTGLAKGKHSLQIGGLTGDRRHFVLAPAIAHFTLQ